MMKDINIQCNSYYDSDLQNISGLTWFPWIGEDYFNSEKRIMIVAESHYSNEINQDNRILELEKHLIQNQYCTREVLKESAIYRDWKNKMFDNLSRTLFGLSSIESITKEYLNHIVFYNFVQRPMDLLQKERPQKEDFRKGWLVFLELIKILEPSDVLFVGVSAINYFESAMKNRAINYTCVKRKEMINNVYGRFCSLSTDTYTLPITAIKHTSKYFSWEDWHGYLMKDFQKPLRYIYGLTGDNLLSKGKVIRRNILKGLYKSGYSLYYVCGEHDIMFPEDDPVAWLQPWVSLGRQMDDNQLACFTIGDYGNDLLYVEVGIRKEPCRSIADTINKKWWTLCYNKRFSLKTENIENEIHKWIQETMLLVPPLVE